MYTEIVFDTEMRWAEALSDALVDAGALSASVEDADAGCSGEEPLFGEPGSEPIQKAWRVSRIVALFDASLEIEPALATAQRMAGLPQLPPWFARSVAEADWVRLTQSQFEPIPIGERLWVVPSWHDRPALAQEGAVVLKLDPGLAFGTGAHATTRMCLRWLEAHVKPGQTVVDYGCGSGILAIAAQKLGAGQVTGTDIDPQAIQASILNARENDCFAKFVPAQEFLHVKADVVVANILASPLQVLAPALSDLVAVGGKLVLSGILARQSEAVAIAYRPWVNLEVWQEDEGWVCLVGQRRGEGIS